MLQRVHSPVKNWSLYIIYSLSFNLLQYHMHIYKRVCIRPSVLRNPKNLKQPQNTKHQTCKHSTGKRHVKSEINDIESDIFFRPTPYGSR